MNRRTFAQSLATAALTAAVPSMAATPTRVVQSRLVRPPRFDP